MIIEKANSNDHRELTEITKLSKAYWGYPHEQLLLWEDALTITSDYIDKNQVFKLVDGKKITGYYSYIEEVGNIIKLDNLFILPDTIGKGYGGVLMNDFIRRVKNTTAKKVVLEADPNAEMFYAKFGFVKTGAIETGIPGRYLPVMELVLP